MKVEISSFLEQKTSLIKELVNQLSRDFEYVSILGADTVGKAYTLKTTGTELNDSPWSERGFVARVHNGCNYSEYSFNEISKETLDDVINKIKDTAKTKVAALVDENIELIPYDIISEESINDSFYSEVAIHPKDLSHSEKLDKMRAVMDEVLSLSEELVDCRIRYEEVHVSKIFISTKKQLAQSYIWTVAAIIPIAVRDGQMKYSLKSLSGMKGAEILDELNQYCRPIVDEVTELLDAERLTPGDYDIICDPAVSGLIAHEAFGHGVEMDMFVKNRAKAVEYMDKPVASELVVMHDGARSAVEVSSYLFDDEGTFGTDTKIIEQGMLKKGISDILSAMKLGTTPTGNGKRESYERKAYSRMTNTFFAAGHDKLSDMIASIDKGYLLEGYRSGMEDPKNWGIQCVITIGKEIINGKLTGKAVAPVLLTGYVPDLLKSISMVSEDIELSGSGYCGKGYKELVKTSTGGPFIKASGRLG